MTRGERILLVGSSLGMASCTATTQNFHVRAIPDPAAKMRFGGGLLVEGRAQLALGGVGVALETFRTFARQQPENPDAYAGIAACYAAMGRYDVARQNYEFALAFAPNDPTLLLALAETLDQLGAPEQASQVRAEAARVRAAPAARASVAQTLVTPLAVRAMSSVTVQLPPPSPVSHSLPVPPKQMAVSKPSGAPIQKAFVPAAASRELTRTAITAPSIRLAPTKPLLASNVEILIPAVAEARQAPAEAVASPLRTAAAVEISTAPIASKRTAPVAEVKIPILARLDELLLSAPIVTPAQAAPATAKLVSVPFARNAKFANVDVAPRSPERASQALFTLPSDQQPARGRHGSPEVMVEQLNRAESGPYLQPLSSGEVSLITTLRPKRLAQSPQRLPPVPYIGQADGTMNASPASAASPTSRVASVPALRWVPLKYASATTNIQLLNAAHTQNLAARMRLALVDRGWRKIGIGNARLTRQHSVVLYSTARAGLARRLAAEFHCKTLKIPGMRTVLVLLGRDTALARRVSARA